MTDGYAFLTNCFSFQRDRTPFAKFGSQGVPFIKWGNQNMALKLIGQGVAVLFAGALVATSVPAAAELTSEQERRLKAAVAGIAIAAAVRKAKKERDREREWERYERGGRYYYNHDWGTSFRPKDDVICFRRTHQCFKEGRYSSKWTAREFGY